MKRTSVSSDTEWEKMVGYSRAIRVGRNVHVSGTTAIGAKNEIVGRDDPYAQTVQIIRNIEVALEKLGASLNDVVRTRIYVVDIKQWSEIGRAHRQFFGEVRPATTMVEVQRLIEPEILVEVEADAVITAE